LNNGHGAWAFEGLARRLSAALWVDVSNTPRHYNYLLHVEDYSPAACNQLFIPYRAVELATDKRLLARAFALDRVPTPETWLFDSLDEVWQLPRSRLDKQWCLKYPTGCGASGHRLLAQEFTLPGDWPRPYLVQEFVHLERPEVYRLYGAGGEIFGWVARRFPAGVKPSPWVAHARGARYERAGEPPPGAVAAARAALSATGLLNSFGCADLLQRPSGEWVVLEVGTDGMFNHVDRDLGDVELETEIQRRIATAFWARVGPPPWGEKGWSPRPDAAVV
jgi:hypothetical protein